VLDNFSALDVGFAPSLTKYIEQQSNKLQYFDDFRLLVDRSLIIV
jgi:hypothetical protein